MSDGVLHVLTGAYPPQTGGVSDYCAAVASGFSDVGVPIHIWSSGVPAGDLPAELPGVALHRLPALFSVRGLRRLARALDQTSAPRVLLLQYSPNVLGWRGMNLFACLWLLMRSRRDEVRVMFHEPYFYFSLRHPLYNVLAVVQRLMAVALLGASRQVYVSSSTWVSRLRPYMWFGDRPLQWLPVPANVPRCDDEAAVQRCRHELSGGNPGVRVVGHFGTYGAHVRSVLEPCLAALAARDSRLRVACLGRHSAAFARDLASRVPALRGRVVASGGLASTEVSAWIRACDVMVQPFLDGVTTRRGSLMAALVNGAPTVTTVGALTEAFWLQEDGIVLAPAGDAPGLADRVIELLGDETRRRALGSAAADLYERRFSVRHSVQRLHAGAADSSASGFQAS